MDWVFPGAQQSRQMVEVEGDFMDRCPAAATLQAFIADRIEEDDLFAIESHVECCVSCQQALERLTNVPAPSRPQGLPNQEVARSRAVGFLQRVLALKTVDGAAAGQPTGALALPQAEIDTPRGKTSAVDKDLRISGYSLFEKLGHGGMGTVYRAEDRMRRRQVALKVMSPSIAADRKARDRFLREARAAASVRHDNVVTIYQVGQENDIPFLAMELLVGQDLHIRLQHEGPMPIAEIVRIGRETASGLAAAHRVGLIHRDIKPANLWLEAPDGRVKILDFGLARQEKEDVLLTRSGAIMGTPAYMSPEQSAGAKVDARSDLFSLGSVLYQLATGQRPFHGETMMAVLNSIRTQEPVPVQELNPDVPNALAASIHRLLAKDPGDRFQSADDVVRALRDVERVDAKCFANINVDLIETIDAIADRTVSPPPPGWPHGRTFAIAGFALLVAVVLVVLAIRQPSKQGGSSPTSADASGGTGNERSPGLLNGPPENRLFDRKLDFDGHVINQIRFDRSSATRAVFAPTGDALVIAGEDGALRRWDLSNRQRPGPPEGEPNQPEWLGAFLPDGKSLVSGDDEGAAHRWLWPGLTKETLQPLDAEPPKSRMWAMAVKPGGGELVTGQDSGWIRTWDLTRGREIDRQRPHPSDLRAIAISHDGQRVLCGGSDGEKAVLFEYDFKSKKVKKLEGHKGPIYGVAYSPDGRFAASVGVDFSLILWRLADASMVARATLPESAFGLSLALRPDGKVIATGDGNGNLRLWELPVPWDAPGGRIAVLTSFKAEGSLIHVGFDATGERIVSCNGKEVIVRDVRK